MLEVRKDRVSGGCIYISKEINMNKVVQTSLALAGAGAIGYLGYRIFKIVKQHKVDMAATEVVELEKNVNDSFKREIDDTDMGENLEPEDPTFIYEAPIERGVIIDETPKYVPIGEFTDSYGMGEKIFPINMHNNKGEAEMFASKGDMADVMFDTESPEALEQFKVYLTAGLTDVRGKDYNFIMHLLSIPVSINEVKDENLAIALRTQRTDFFGDDISDEMVNDFTFGEVLIELSETVSFDWDIDQLQVIYNMLDNIDWNENISQYGELKFAQKVAEHNFTDADIVDSHIGFFHLPQSALTNIVNDPDYGFWNQYNDSDMGDE